MVQAGSDSRFLVSEGPIARHDSDDDVASDIGLRRPDWSTKSTSLGLPDRWGSRLHQPRAFPGPSFEQPSARRARRGSSPPSVESLIRPTLSDVVRLL
jgi:hypothetical protein